MHNKATYLKSGINKMLDNEIFELIKRIIEDNDCPELLEMIDRYLDVELFDITTVTRRKIINWLSEQNDLEGEIRIDKFLNRIWDLKNMPSIYGEANREKDILRHMVNNDDLSYKDLLEDVLKVIYVSDSTFIRFLEELVYPDIHEEQRQKEYVDTLNSYLKNDGYNLINTNHVSGKPIYNLQKSLRGVSNEIKNIIFAGIGGKPDIVIDDSLSNTIKLVDNGANCLIYNQPILAHGLSWRELVEWWSSKNYSVEIGNALFKRLIESMDSNPEKNFMWVYYTFIIKKKPELPALIPQVYCHYDPKSANMRNGAVYVHQRMDFLMLFSDRERVVIEIDGKQHYSEENIASPKLYAEMVEDDRKLKLYGYNVFRFGGYEFLKEQRPKEKIIIFFENLFKLYGITI